MKIDTNLKIDREAIKNLNIDKAAILRPNAPPLSNQTGLNPKKVPQSAAFKKQWEEFFAALFGQPVKSQSQSKTPVKHNNSLPKAQSLPVPAHQTLNDTIRYCILHKVRSELEYDGGKRTVEIYSWGQNTVGHDVIRVYQVSGYSKSGQLGFKTFLTSKIKDLKVLYNQKFLMQAGYKKNDEEMRKIYLQL